MFVFKFVRRFVYSSIQYGSVYSYSAVYIEAAYSSIQVRIQLLKKIDMLDVTGCKGRRAER